MSGPIASAVVLPDADSPPASPPHTLKRRQSSATSESAKRPRVADDADASTAPAPKRRERGRERRLFGAVLGALSQNPTTAGQKRRSEIEKRQFAQRRQEDEESEARKAERLAQRRVQRVKETQRFERLAMNARHDNMLHLAHFLCTKTEPRLYYKPWEMSPAEEDSIEVQIAEAKGVIQREKEEFEEREEEERRRERRSTPDEWTYRGAAVSDDTKREHQHTHTQAEAKDPTNGALPLAQDHEMQDQHADETPHIANKAPAEPAVDTTPPAPEPAADEPSKDADEEVVEAAEDTVIY